MSSSPEHECLRDKRQREFLERNGGGAGGQAEYFRIAEETFCPCRDCCSSSDEEEEDYFASGDNSEDTYHEEESPSEKSVCFSGMEDSDHGTDNQDLPSEADNTSERSCRRYFRHGTDADVGSTSKDADGDSEESRSRGNRAFSYWRRIAKLPFKRRILHDIIPSQTWSQTLQFASKIRENTRKANNYILLSWHPESDGVNGHIHIVHDCPWHSNTCKCSILRNHRVKHRDRRPRYQHECDWKFWRNLTIYLHNGPRNKAYFEFAGRERNLPVEIATYQNFETERHRKKEVVQTCGDGNDLFNSGTSGSEGDEMEIHARGRESKDQENRRLQKNYWNELQVYRLLKLNPCCPPLNIVSTDVWLKSRFRFEPRYWPKLVKAEGLFNTELSKMTIQEFVKYYNTCVPLFSAPNGNMDYYYDVNESFRILNELLIFQFGAGHVRSFINILYQVLDKAIPKKNCIQVVGEPSSGKNFFFDCILDFFLNHGSIGNFNRYNNFPLQDARDRRVLLWNEPNIEPSAYDTLKMLCGGDSMPVKIKYHGDVRISKTPIIILTNHNVIPQDQAFQDRVFTFNWKRCPKLKDYRKKPHPLVFIEFINMYVDLE